MADTLSDMIPDEIDHRLIAAGQRMKYADGALIHQRGDRKPGLSVVRSGAVRVGNPGLDGVYVAASVMTRGDIFGEATLFADLPRTHEAVAVGPTEVDQIGRAAFLEILQSSPELSHAMLRVVTTRLYGALDYLDDLQRLPLPVRLAKHLLATRQGNDVRDSQTAIAERLGVSRVSISKALNVLKAEGLVAPGYGRIALQTKSLTAYVSERLAVPPLRPSKG